MQQKHIKHSSYSNVLNRLDFVDQKSVRPYKTRF